MKKAERLLLVLQILRRRRGPTRAYEIAEELEVSERTIYRDMRGLQGMGVPIEGEAGFGYVLGDGLDLPPLMFTPEEIEAVALGARMVSAQGDPDLALAATDVLAKVAHVLPAHLRQIIPLTALYAPTSGKAPEDTVSLPELRAAMRDYRKVSMTYVDVNGEETQRTILPIALAFYGPTKVLGAWCELRNDFRSFRTDRILVATPLEEKFTRTAARLRSEFQRLQEARAT